MREDSGRGVRRVSFAKLTFTFDVCRYLGDGPKLVRELFRVADEHSPSIVFIGGPSRTGTVLARNAPDTYFRISGQSTSRMSDIAGVQYQMSFYST